MVSAPESEVILECSMPYNVVPRQISVAIVQVAIPFCAWAFVLLLWLVAKTLAPAARALFDSIRTRVGWWRGSRGAAASFSRSPGVMSTRKGSGAQVDVPAPEALDAHATATVTTTAAAADASAITVVLGGEEKSGFEGGEGAGAEEEEDEALVLLPLSYRATLMVITITTIFVRIWFNYSINHSAVPASNTVTIQV